MNVFHDNVCALVAAAVSSHVSYMEFLAKTLHQEKPNEVTVTSKEKSTNAKRRTYLDTARLVMLGGSYMYMG